MQISRLFDDVSTSVKLQNAVSEIARWRFNFSPYDAYKTVRFAEMSISRVVSQFSLSVAACVCWINELTKIDERFAVYFSAVVLLHVALKISRNDIDGDMTEILVTVLGRNFDQFSAALSRQRTKLNTPELVGLLQKSTVDYLTTYRQLAVPEFAVTFVSTDYEALYAYKRSDYQRCLQLCTQNVHTLFCAVHVDMTVVPILPEFIPLMDDDIVSLTALTLIAECRKNGFGICISQLTLSVYLMTQCQLKLHHSVTSLAQTLAYIKITQIKCPRSFTSDQLVLQLSKRKVAMLSGMTKHTKKYT